MKEIWISDGGVADNVERLILKGKLTVPGKNKVLSTKSKFPHYELYEWWKTYLGNPKYPQWKNIIEEVIDMFK